MKNGYKFRLPSTILLLAILVIAGVNITSLQQVNPSKHNSTITERHIVTRIIDGDTIIVDAKTTIRLIGIDTPERNEKYYEEATEHLKQLINNRHVILELDQNTLDPYGRTLAYVHSQDLLINLQMVQDGWARTMPIQPNLLYATKLREAEIKAKKQKIGIWE